MTPDIWRTTIDLADAGEESTLVTVTVTYEPENRSLLVRWLQRGRWQRMVQRTVDGELTKLPEHVGGVVRDQPAAIELQRRSDGGSAPARPLGRVRDQKTGLARHLDGVAVAILEVAEVTYLDSTALPLLLRWARRPGGAGRPAIIRGSNDQLDADLGEMGLRSVFVRQD